MRIVFDTGSDDLALNNQPVFALPFDYAVGNSSSVNTSESLAKSSPTPLYRASSIALIGDPRPVSTSGSSKCNKGQFSTSPVLSTCTVVTWKILL